MDIVSHENFARVVSVAHEVAEDLLGVKQVQDKEELKPVIIAPVDDKKLWIKIPIIESKVQTNNNLQFFLIVMHLEELKKIAPKFIKADIVSTKTEEIGNIKIEAIKEEIDPVNRFVRLTIREMTELDVSFKSVLQKIVKYYLDQIKADKDVLSKLVKLHEKLSLMISFLK